VSDLVDVSALIEASRWHRGPPVDSDGVDLPQRPAQPGHMTSAVQKLRLPIP